MSDDLSYEAFGEWCREHGITNRRTARKAWQECRRRAEAMLEERDKEIAMLRGWKSSELKQFEEEKREAIDLGFREGYEFSCTPEGQTRTFSQAKEAYRAYQAERSGQ
jgi:hypothetical protein